MPLFTPQIRPFLRYGRICDGHVGGPHTDLPWRSAILQRQYRRFSAPVGISHWAYLDRAALAAEAHHAGTLAPALLPLVSRTFVKGPHVFTYGIVITLIKERAQGVPHG